MDAVKRLITSDIPVDQIDLGSIEENLYHPEIPNIDLIIRTSGEQRISGFMLYRAAYAELSFVQKFWPDFTTNDFDNELDKYAKLERRFGT